MNKLLAQLGVVLAADPSLGGLVDFCTAGVPTFEDLPIQGAAGIKMCMLRIFLY